MKFSNSIALAIPAITALLALLTGCASVTPGMSRDEVLAHYGQPSAVVALPAGTRLQYSLQPEGRSAVMVDLDSSSKVTSVREVMTPQEFAKVQIGKWTRADVERELGRPGKVDRVYSWPNDILTYRWRDASQNMYFWVYLDANNVVQRTGQGMEFPMSLIRN